MAAVRTVLSIGVLVGAVGAAFVALTVMSGLVDPDDVPFWPTTTPLCASDPTFTVRGASTSTVLVVDGPLDVAGVDALLAERGHDAVLELAPVEGATDVRIVAVAPSAPAEVEGLLRTGGTVGPNGATQVVLGPDTYAGDWVVRVRCAAG